ncbi:MAG: 7,8-dihydro-6-hydroxymethylpterin dimethyltransferase [Acidobacteriota bacterium]|nr:7,8-dihydro-6-hydroxymethylpterin dimethyltransferase [Acidobacteriota bacterium]
MPGMPLRGDRLLRYVSAFCPHCHAENPERPLALVRRLSGYLAEEDGQVWLVRGCPEHGKVRTFYDESAEILSYLEEWTAPTKRHVPDVAGNFDPIPEAYLRGLGEMQTQHTCILLEDIDLSCNLCCPNCFASSSPELSGAVPVAEILANIDTRLSREEGRLDVLMLSGGEPTVHPRLLDLLDAALDRPIGRILLNSNGIEIAQNDRLLAYLEKHRKRIEVYLQFDGFRLETHRHHRGADLRRIKQQAVDRLSAAGVFTTLTMTAALGVNDDEIGDVILYALETPFVGGVSIQPQFGSGRSTPIDPQARLTHTGVLARLEAQTGGLVHWRDLTALPCSHPHCCSIGYLMRTDAGTWRSLAAILGHERLKAHLELVSNRIVDPGLSAELRSLVKQSLLGLFSESSSLSQPSIGELFGTVCQSCDLGLSDLVRLAGSTLTGKGEGLRDLLGRRVKRITVKPFMDVHTMIEERLVQCCVHVGTARDTADGIAAAHQCVPFCAAQAWVPLSRMKLSERAGRASLGAALQEA